VTGTERVSQIVDKVGVPTALLAVILFSFYQATQWVGENILLPYVQQTNSTIIKLKDDTSTNSIALSGINELVLKSMRAGEERTDLLEAILKEQQAVLAEQKRTTAAVLEGMVNVRPENR